MDVLPNSDGLSYACLDMDSETDQAASAKIAPNLFDTIYVTSHKAPCRAGAFSNDGKLIATGSVDASIKILDVDRMISKSISHNSSQQHNNGDSNQNADIDNNNTENDDNSQQEQQSNQEISLRSNNKITNNDQTQQHQNQHHNQSAHPVIRTLYDHTEEVTHLQFHPDSPILASGSLDMTIKFYDYMRASAKRAHKTLQEASPVRCFKFHPSGNYMLVGCQQPTLRLYDVNTMQSFVSSNPLDQHNQPITMIDYNQTGSIYATASKDGDIKIWDGVSNRCVNSFRRAHDGAELSSIQISRNGKYLLSAAKDHLVKLWEISMASCLQAYQGASSSSTKNHRAQAIFNHTEDYILFPDSRNTNLHSWNARTGAHLNTLALHHNNSVRYIVHSSVNPAFLTCSEDFRARFWSIREKASTNN